MQVEEMLSESYWLELEAHFAAREAQLSAFLPEPGRFSRLRREAAELVARYPEPDGRPLLFGLLVGVKDIFSVAGFPTRAGSRLPAELFAGPEAESVTRLKQAGALILGKTVTTEFAYFGPGPTRNPHNPAHTPGGSSSGSAAAVAAGLCDLALGTQTIGSIIRPAAFCGVVGLKPSFGRISTEGVIPVSTSLDTVGFFTGSVAAAAQAAPVLYQDWRDTPIPGDRPVLGVPLGPYLQKASPEALTSFEASQQKLSRAGFELRPVEVMPDFADVVTRHNSLMAAEAAAVHRDWFARYADLYHPKTADLIRRGQAVSPEQVERYRAGREQLRRELTALMAAHSISAWLAPSAVGSAPAGLESTGDPIMNLPWTHAGLPSINLPAGLAASGLPLGLQVVAGWQEDEKLLAWAELISQALL